MNDRQTDSFSRGIAGQPAGPDDDGPDWRLGAELREAVQAREADLEQAELARFSLDQPHMKALQERVHRHLSSGEAPAASAAAAARPVKPQAPRPGHSGRAGGGLAAALDVFFGSAWGRGALVLALASMGTMLVMQSPRGGGGPQGGIVERSSREAATLKTPGPAALAAALEARLAALGATVTSVELRPGHWTLDVVAKDATQMQAVQAVLDEYGLPRFAGTQARITIQALDGAHLGT